MDIILNYIENLDEKTLGLCFKEQEYLKQTGTLPEISYIKGLSRKIKELINSDENCIELAIKNINFVLAKKYVELGNCDY